MGTQGIGTFLINSKFASGNLVFYEKGVGRTTTGDLFTVGTDTITVGGTAQDVDLKVYLGSATEYVLFDVGNSRVDFGEDSQGVDIRIFGDTASSLLLWDTSDDRLEFDGCDLNLQDSDILQFGDAQDVAITWDGSNLTIIPATDNTGVIQIGNDGTKSMDVKFFGATADYGVSWDMNGDTNGSWLFGADDYGVDVSFYGQTISNSMVWDASANGLLFTGTAAGFTMGATGVPAGDFILWGTQTGSKVWLDVDGDTNGAFYFGANDYGVDVGFYGQTISNSMIWDASADALVFTAGGITMGVTSKLVVPVKASGSATRGDLWLDTDDGYIHFYDTVERIVTTTAA